VRRDQGAGHSDEVASEITRGQAAVRGVGMGVAEAAGIGSGGEGTAASIGETALAAIVCRFGMLRSHAERIIYCVYSCLVTGSYREIRMGV